MTQRFRVGVDIGGTFTDLIVVNSETGAFAIGKVLTTPSDPSEAVETVLMQTLHEADIPLEEVSHLIHGTTLVTNAMIERKGALTALLTTQGFKDSVEIGRETRYDLYDLMIELPQPLVPRYLRFDVPQRTVADGSSLVELDEAYVERLTQELVANGVEAIAVCFLHSFTNPEAEQRAREAIQRVSPKMRVSLSSEVVAEIREYERASTTIANVYVQQLVEKYLGLLEARLAQVGFVGSFFLMLSSGGIATVETASRFPVRLLESGPAAGALAAQAYAAAIDMQDVLSFDMGGTTAKICVIADGEPLIAHEFEVDRRYRFKKGSGLPIKLPVIELIEIGTGGGSIARVDALGLLKVGPDSAASVPGPVCYGRGGTEPTVTDANLILGYLDPSYFLGGKMQLNLEATRQAIHDRIACKLGLTVEEAAWGIHQIANENMANAARVHTLERGKDARRFPMFAFGGAGPMHAYRIAKSLGCPTLIAPLGAGVMSTVGFLSAPMAFDFVRSLPMILDQPQWDKINALLQEMQSEGEALLIASGVPIEQIQHKRTADMRYVGQGHEISVELPTHTLSQADLTTVLHTFEAVYQELYERLGPPVAIEVMNWRVVSSGVRPDLRLQVNKPNEIDADGGVQRSLKGYRHAYFPEANGYVNTPVYDRYQLFPGATFNAPAIIEERESTVIVGPGARCQIDEQYNLIIHIQYENAEDSNGD